MARGIYEFDIRDDKKNTDIKKRILEREGGKRRPQFYHGKSFIQRGFSSFFSLYIDIRERERGSVFFRSKAEHLFSLNRKPFLILTGVFQRYEKSDLNSCFAREKL